MTEKMSFEKLIPSSWFNDATKSSIWVAGYRMMLTTRKDFSQVPLTIDLNNVRAIFLYGKLTYLDSSKVEFGDEHAYQINTSHGETNVGSWTILITPKSIDGHERPEPEVRNTLSIAEGLLAALNSPNIVFKNVFENIIELSSGNTTAFSPTFINPATTLSPKLNTEALQMLSQSSINLQTLPENIQNRVILSLRWYSKSLIESRIVATVDEFLSIWIAIEVIGMPDTSNVKPAIELLAKIYQMDYSVAAHRFQLGRIHGFRSKIVHDGKMFPIHFLLTKYLEAVYIDLLMETLNLPHERRAEQVLNNPQFDLEKFININ